MLDFMLYPYVQGVNIYSSDYGNDIAAEKALLWPF
jgi:hypothetical protein